MSLQSPENGLAGRRVLVIEDESLVSMLLEDSLAAIGCEIVGFGARFDQALEMAKSLSFDLAILDVNLNGRESFPIADALLERGISFVFATGYGAASLPPLFQSVPVLNKPFQQSQLESVLYTALGVQRR